MLRVGFVAATWPPFCGGAGFWLHRQLYIPWERVSGVVLIYLISFDYYRIIPLIGFALTNLSLGSCQKMDAQILAIKCPACGNTSNLGGKELRYGYQFTCPHCSTTSVLIINGQLYSPKLGEHVCTTCGRIAIPPARFCQCGAPLVRKCTNINCQKEFPIDHLICDFCGWQQDINQTNSKELEAKIDNAIRALSSIDRNIRMAAVSDIRVFGLNASKAIPVLLNLYINSHDHDEKSSYIITLGELGENAVPPLIEILYSESDEDLLRFVGKKLEVIGKNAKPGLTNLIKNTYSDKTRARAKDILSRIN
jgi:hypothetical protein